MVTATATAMLDRRRHRNVKHWLIIFGPIMSCVSYPASSGDWKITPTIALNETASDNLFLSTTQARGGLISDINPGIRIDGSGGRSKLHFDYQMHNLLYTADPSRNNQVQNSLNAFGTLEALENWFFIDATGVISQQSISAFGAAPTATNVNTNINSNITETSTYSISPYFRGSFGNLADYQLRYKLISTTSKSGSASDSDTKAWIAGLKGKTTLASLNWSLDGSATTIEQGNLRSKDDNRLRGTLSYKFNPQFQVSLIGGREENNYENLEMKSSTISGAGFAWSPTERTKMSFSRENRFFGPSNTLSFSHRTAGTAWQISSSKDVTAQPIQQQSGLGTNVDLLSSITSADATTALGGITPNAQQQGGYLSNQIVVRQLQQISFALLGVRNTVTFAATQNNTQNLSIFNGAGSGVGSGPSQNNVDQLGASVNWSHRLTPLSSITGTVSHLNSKGTGTGNFKTTQQLISLNIVTRLGPKTNAGFGVRRVVVDGTTNYTENALTATLSHQF